MCANYEGPVQLALDFNTQPVTFEFKRDLYPVYYGPILLPMATQDDELLPVRAMFGMVPFWAKDTKLARQTYNARSETVKEKPSFRAAWKQRQFCLIPVQSFYEPNYETGKPVRWRIRRRDGKPFALAGIYESCSPKDDSTDGENLRSFSMLTINAAEHPLMRRFHATEDEKRSVVILDPADYSGWLKAKTEDDARSFLQPFDAGAFTAEPAPRLPRVPTGAGRQARLNS